jgi:hypothetical protein
MAPNTGLRAAAATRASSSVRCSICSRVEDLVDLADLIARSREVV